jgi:hypothetical protein
MWNIVMGLPLPLILVFGLYHLMMWFNILRINRLVYWKRVGLASSIAHALLVTGFFVFTYFDYRANRDLSGFGLGYGTYLFDRSQFWPLMAIFDTLPMAILVGLFLLLDWLGLALPGLLLLTIAITFAAGTVEWYFVGGGLGTMLSRFWDALKIRDDEDFQG